MIKEVWKKIEGYENYEVSSCGNIRKNGKTIIKPEVHHKGYLRVDLFRDRNRKHMKVHRLVAEAFIPNPENKPQINHKDFNKQNNCIDNLEWVTNSENHDHYMRNRKNATV